MSRIKYQHTLLLSLFVFAGCESFPAERSQTFEEYLQRLSTRLEIANISGGPVFEVELQQLQFRDFNGNGSYDRELNEWSYFTIMKLGNIAAGHIKVIPIYTGSFQVRYEKQIKTGPSVNIVVHTSNPNTVQQENQTVRLNMY